MDSSDETGTGATMNDSHDPRSSPSGPPRPSLPGVALICSSGASAVRVSSDAQYEVGAGGSLTDLYEGLCWASTADCAERVELGVPHGMIQVPEGATAAVVVRASGLTLVGAVRGQPVVLGAAFGQRSVLREASVAYIGRSGSRVIAGIDPAEILPHWWLEANARLDAKPVVDAPIALAAGPVLPVDTEILDGAGVVTWPGEETADENPDENPGEETRDENPGEPDRTQLTSDEPVAEAARPMPLAPLQTPSRRHRAIPRSAPWAVSGAVLSLAMVTAAVATVTAPPNPARVASPVAQSVQRAVTPRVASAGSDALAHRSTAALASRPGAVAGPLGAMTDSASGRAQVGVAVPIRVTTSTTAALPVAANGGAVQVDLLTCTHLSGLLQMTGEASNAGASAKKVSVSGLFVNSVGTTIGTSRVTVIVPAHASQPWSLTYSDPTASSGRCQMAAVASATT